MIARDSGWLVRAEEIFSRAILRPEEEREAFVEEACNGDADLKERILGIIEEHVTTDDSFLAPINFLELFPSAKLKMNSKFGNFGIVSVLGSGGMGTVYEAYQAPLNRHVALKVMSSVLLRNPKNRARFYRGAQMAAQLHHKNIAEVYLVGEQDGELFLAAEYVDGTTLDKHIRANNPSLAEKLTYVEQIADALAYAHGKGVVHRDVKPQNILIDTEGCPRLVDFGLSRTLEDDGIGITDPGTSPGGTWAYMSPEQANGAVDPRADIFSLGIVLFEVLVGTKPRRNRQDRDAPKSLRKALPTISRTLERVCLRAIQENPEDRYATAQEFGDAIRAARDGNPTGLKPLRLARTARVLRQWPMSTRLAVLTLCIAAIWGAVLGGLAIHSAFAYPSISAAVDGPIASLYRLPLDLFSMPQGQHELLGRTPLVHAPFRPGYVRLVATSPLGFSERSMLILEETGDIEVVLRILPTEDVVDSMVLIPEGSFVYGTGDMGVHPHYKREMNIDAFYIDPYEVSNGDYEQFLQATGWPRPRHWTELKKEIPDWEELPVVNVSHLDASTYAYWCGKRLPTLPELQRASRGPDGWLYPWGNDGEKLDQAVLGVVVQSTDDRLHQYAHAVVPVDRRLPIENSATLLHTLGNVEEWTDTPGAEYPAPGFTNATEIHHSDRAVFGFGWAHPFGEYIGLDSYLASPVDIKTFSLGFRCAKSAGSPGP